MKAITLSPKEINKAVNKVVDLSGTATISTSFVGKGNGSINDTIIDTLLTLCPDVKREDIAYKVKHEGDKVVHFKGDTAKSALLNKVFKAFIITAVNHVEGMNDEKQGQFVAKVAKTLESL